MLLGLLDPDPDPDPLVRGRIWILLSPGENSKKNLESYCVVTSF
jgi:hypothetical protein